MTDDLIDTIDALIDEQLAAGEPETGYDYDDPTYPSCPHCAEKWHGLAITTRMLGMRFRGVIDPDYRYAEDDSRVLCPGSDFIGPMPAVVRTSPASGPWTIGALRELRMGFRTYRYPSSGPPRRPELRWDGDES